MCPAPSPPIPDFKIQWTVGENQFELTPSCKPVLWLFGWDMTNEQKSVWWKRKVKQLCSFIGIVKIFQLAKTGIYTGGLCSGLKQDTFIDNESDQGLSIYYVIQDRGEGSSQFITILQRGGSPLFITILHGGGGGLPNLLQSHLGRVFNVNWYIIVNVPWI